jgi:octaprenyl-diphosphate synthase
MAGASDDEVDAISEFALDVGLAFQIVDDVLDIAGERKSTGKTVGIDILEGKPTLPIIYAMEDPAAGGKIRKIFEKKEVSPEDLKEVLELIKKTDAIERCLSKAKETAEKAMPLLSALKDSAHKDSMISLARFIVSRDR